MTSLERPLEGMKAKAIISAADIIILISIFFCFLFIYAVPENVRGISHSRFQPFYSCVRHLS